MADVYDVEVTVKRSADTQRNTGHIPSNASLNSVYTGVKLRKHNYSGAQWQRLESELGPGIRTKKMFLFLTYDKPFPDIRINDQLVITMTTQDGVINTKYNVHNARQYEYSFQVDAENVK